MPQGAHSPRSTNESHSGLGQPSMVTWQDGYCLLGHCQDLPRLPTPPQSPDPPKAEPGPFPVCWLLALAAWVGTSALTVPAQCPI